MGKLVFTVLNLYELYRESLGLRKTKASSGIKNRILSPEVQRPGLALAGLVVFRRESSLLIFGRMELEYLSTLDTELCTERLKGVLTKKTPAVILSRNLKPPKELLELCKILEIPIFQTHLKSIPLMAKLIGVLNTTFSPILTCHGTLVEAYGIGVLIQGDSSIGKSETALGLIERGHRLISDDVVRIQKKEGDHLEGTGPKLNQHLLEIRGIGIINTAHLFGAVSVRSSVNIDMIMHLEEWNDRHFYDRVGLEERFNEILGVKVPLYILPVKPGRDVVLLLEATVLNHRLKGMGYHSAKEFNQKLLEEIARKRENSFGK